MLKGISKILLLISIAIVVIIAIILVKKAEAPTMETPVPSQSKI
jgi:hypothetical protein